MTKHVIGNKYGNNAKELPRNRIKIDAAFLVKIQQKLKTKFYEITKTEFKNFSNKYEKVERSFEEQTDIIKLQQLIQNETGMTVSPQTLINIFSIKFVYQRNTLDIILSFIDQKAHQDKVVEYKEYLNNLYDEWRIAAGCILSNEAWGFDSNNEDIVRWWALFHNRNMDWSTVRRTLEKKISEDVGDNLKTVCLLGIFESHLNEFTSNRHEQDAFKILEKNRTDFLETIPNKETNGQYHYFLARFLEDKWWLLTDKTKETSTPWLSKIFGSLETSLSLYEQKHSSSGYQSSYSVPWWLDCHKAIVLHLLGNPEKKQNLLDSKKRIEQEITKTPRKKSLQVYAATYYLLLDDAYGLKKFLKGLNENIKKQYGQDIKENISEDDNFTFHHVELIFYNDEKKRKIYIEILNEGLKKRIMHHENNH